MNGASDRQHERPPPIIMAAAPGLMKVTLKLKRPADEEAAHDERRCNVQAAFLVSFFPWEGCGEGWGGVGRGGGGGERPRVRAIGKRHTPLPNERIQPVGAERDIY